MKVHLVDGTFELFRAYYGSPSSETADGFELGAVRGLLRSMLALAAPDVKATLEPQGAGADLTFRLCEGLFIASRA